MRGHGHGTRFDRGLSARGVLGGSHLRASRQWHTHQWHPGVDDDGNA